MVLLIFPINMAFLYSKTNVRLCANMKIFMVFLVCFASSGNSLPIGCEINPVTSSAPLIINPGTANLIHPEPGHVLLKFPTKSSVEFSCPGRQVTTNGTNLGSLVTGICQTNDIFNIHGQSVSWSTIRCSNTLTPIVKELKLQDLHDSDPNIQCFDSEETLRIIQIGFTLDANRFLGVIDICFNSVTKIPVYSYYKLSAAINQRARNVQNPAFRQDDIYYRMGRSIHQMYRNNQTTINALVGLDPTSEKYVNRRTFINRGHLAAKVDFVYAPLQQATFRYINVAPQWNTFNGGNWNQAEISVRNYATENKYDLQVWTGTAKNSVLINENTLAPQNLYLYVDDTDRRHSPSFPIAAIFWKVVYEPITQRGIVLIGHNNPYQNITSASQKVCNTDVSGQVKWLRWNQNNTRNGFSYACDCNDSKFRGLVTVLPKFIIRGLLV